MILFKPAAFADTAEVVSREDLNALLFSLAPNSAVDDEYDRFLQMGEEQIKALVERYWDASGLCYGINAPDFPLCYDFAELCAAAVRLGAIKEGLTSRPAFGVLRYTMTSGKRHAICFAVTSTCQVKYFEPQIVATRWTDAPVDVKTLDAYDI